MLYTFQRETGFYPLDLDDDSQALENAHCNPGTLLVVNEITHDIVFDAHRKSPKLQQLTGWNRATLPGELVRRKLLNGAEIGVQKGEYSQEFLRAGVKKLVLVDLWARQPDYFDIANVEDAQHEKNFLETKTRVFGPEAKFYGTTTRILRGQSTLMARQIEDGSLDFVYIDADHKYKSVKADLTAWYPKVRNGGIICGHDLLDSPNNCGSEFGVETAVKEFCREIGVTEIFVCVGECWPNWHFFKPTLKP